MGWQPIETAPLGQWVLVSASKADEMGVRFYTARKEEWEWEGEGGIHYEGPYADGYTCLLSDIGVEPTHWMPLPDPPLRHQEKPGALGEQP
jgi:hypothetical protein